MPQIPQDEGFDDYISIDLAGERYTVQLEKWAQFVSLDRDNMQQFLQENDSSRRTTLTSVYPPLLCASGPFIFQPGKSGEAFV
jgi:hypothetical protein